MPIGTPGADARQHDTHWLWMLICRAKKIYCVQCECSLSPHTLRVEARLSETKTRPPESGRETLLQWCFNRDGNWDGSAENVKWLRWADSSVAVRKTLILRVSSWLSRSSKKPLTQCKSHQVLCVRTHVGLLYQVPLLGAGATPSAWYFVKALASFSFFSWQISFFFNCNQIHLRCNLKYYITQRATSFNFISYHQVCVVFGDILQFQRSKPINNLSLFLCEHQ